MTNWKRRKVNPKHDQYLGWTREGRQRKRESKEPEEPCFRHEECDYEPCQYRRYEP